MKEQENQLLQAELETRTTELSEKMEQINQQVMKIPSISRVDLDLTDFCLQLHLVLEHR